MSCCDSTESLCEVLKIVKDTDVVIDYVFLIDGVPSDITDFTFYMGVKEYASDSTLLLELSSGAGDFVITDAAAGLFTLTIPRESTSGLTESQGVYDIQYVDASAQVGVFRQLSTIYLIEGVAQVP